MMFHENDNGTIRYSKNDIPFNISAEYAQEMLTTL